MKLGTFFFQVVIGAIAATVLTGVSFALVYAMLSPFGFGVIFVAPLLIGGLIVAFLPAALIFLAGLFRFERIGYSAGVVVAALAVFAGISIVRLDAQNEYKARLAFRAIIPPSKPPKRVALACGDCQFLPENWLISTNIPMTIYPDGQPNRAYEIIKVPDAACASLPDAQWNEYAVRNGYIDFCFVHRPVAPLTDGVLFRLGKSYSLHEGVRINGFGAYELVQGKETTLTRWENGRVVLPTPVSLFAPTSILVNTPFGYAEVVGPITGVSLLSIGKSKAGRDPVREIEWALVKLNTDNPQLLLSRLAAIVLRERFQELGPARVKHYWPKILDLIEKSPQAKSGYLVDTLELMDETDLASQADLLFDLILKDSAGADTAFRLFFQTRAIDPQRYSKQAEAEFLSLMNEFPQDGDWDANNYSARLGWLYKLALSGGEEPRTRLNTAILTLHGVQLKTTVVGLTYGARRISTTLDWAPNEVSKLIELSEEFTGEDLANYINAIRSSNEGRLHREEMLKSMQRRLTTTTRPDDQKIIGHLIEIIPTDVDM